MIHARAAGFSDGGGGDGASGDVRKTAKPRVTAPASTVNAHLAGIDDFLPPQYDPDPE